MQADSSQPRPYSPPPPPPLPRLPRLRFPRPPEPYCCCWYTSLGCATLISHCRDGRTVTLVSGLPSGPLAQNGLSCAAPSPIPRTCNMWREAISRVVLRAQGPSQSTLICPLAGWSVIVNPASYIHPDSNPCCRWPPGPHPSGCHTLPMAPQIQTPEILPHDLSRGDPTTNRTRTLAAAHSIP